ncbi:MAG: ABC transporter permease [Lachnospiraceae bacterium]|nr:ABC transporter permease [Lachnospiraceae bacterium]
MNIFRKLTVKQLLKNRTRTLVTIVGIVLSASMICAVTTFASSLQQMMLDQAIYGNGDYYGSSEHVSAGLVEALRQDRRVSELFTAEIQGYAYLDGGVNTYKPYLYLLGVDSEFVGKMPVHLTSGRLPEKDGEVLIPNHVAANGGVELELGQEITLNVGDRVGSDGVLLFQNTAFLCNEKEQPLESIVGREVKNYTVVGFYERPGFENFTAPGYTVLTVKGEVIGEDSAAGDRTYIDKAISEGEESNTEDTLGYSVYIKTRNPSRLTELQYEYGLDMEINQSVLRYSGFLGDSGYGQMIYGFALIVIGIIMFGSISLIYNAFAISVSERTRQYGLLASLGATRKQLKAAVLFEAMIVGVIGVPLGIICGIAGIGVTLYLLRDMIQNMLGMEVALDLHVSWISVAAALVIAAVTIRLSAWIPARRATRITPMEAIRQSSDVKVRAREVRISPLTYRLFGVEGMIGAKYFKRDRKRYRATIVSLMMSIFLFISASALTMYLTDSIGGRMSFVGDYDLSMAIYYDDFWSVEKAEERRAEIEAMAGVEQTAYFVQGSGDRISISPDILSPEYEAYLNHVFGESYAEIVSEENYWFSTGVVYLSDREYLAFAEQQGINVEMLLNREVPLAIGYSMETSYVEDSKQYTRNQILKDASPEDPIALDLRIWQWNEAEETGDKPATSAGGYVVARSLPVGASATELPFCLSESEMGQITLIYPISVYERMEDTKSSAYGSVTYRVSSSDHSETEKALLEKQGDWNGHIINYAAQIEEERSIVTVINVFAYGFIILISLIAVTNVFNTISTNVSLRRREFAMLKSMGMNNRGLQRMLNYECVLYGMRSLIMGLPMSIAMTWVIFRITDMAYMTNFYLPWHAIGIAVFSVFFVVFITMMYAMNKIKNENPIDALKSELA